MCFVVYRMRTQVLSELQEEGDSGKNVILEFFQEATLEELMATPGCSRKKSELIIEQRPFNTWTDMVGTRCRRSDVLVEMLIPAATNVNCW